jgi:hypothetical protein
VTYTDISLIFKDGIHPEITSNAVLIYVPNSDPAIEQVATKTEQDMSEISILAGRLFHPRPKSFVRAHSEIHRYMTDFPDSCQNLNYRDGSRIFALSIRGHDPGAGN